MKYQRGIGMSKFSDYINTETVNKSEGKIDNKNNYEEMIDKYSKLSNDELISEFIKLTAKEKKNGNLKDRELESIKNTISPYLDAKQNKNLDSLINLVKDVK